MINKQKNDNTKIKFQNFSLKLNYIKKGFLGTSTTNKKLGKVPIKPSSQIHIPMILSNLEYEEKNKDYLENQIQAVKSDEQQFQPYPTAVSQQLPTCNLIPGDQFLS